MTSPTFGERGHYARRQLSSKARLIAWSHRQRLVPRHARGRLLDYGCGDGTFLRMIMNRPEAPAAAVGAETDDGEVND